MQPKPPYRVFLGWDQAEAEACQVALDSLRCGTDTRELLVRKIGRSLVPQLYDRPTTTLPNGQLFDEISDAPMSTDHAIARFLIPYLCNYLGWALFTDGDVLFREDVRQLFAMADPAYAIQVVKHRPQVEEGQKKAGHIQQAYHRKNWSSVMLFHCEHPANQALTLEVVNEWPGRELHAFNWLTDGLIGALPARWNHLVGVSKPQTDPALVHYTLGCPNLPGHERDPFAAEWLRYARPERRVAI